MKICLVSFWNGKVIWKNRFCMSVLDPSKNCNIVDHVTWIFLCVIKLSYPVSFMQSRRVGKLINVFVKGAGKQCLVNCGMSVYSAYWSVLKWYINQSIPSRAVIAGWILAWAE